jgi:hypothetical protein
MRIDASGHSFVFPAACACCCSLSDVEMSVSASKSSGKRVVHTSTNAWDIPYCSRCIGHVNAVESGNRLIGILTFVALFFGAVLWYAAGSTMAAASTILMAIAIGLSGRSLTARARSQCSTDCACVGKAVAYLGWHGTVHQFEISSPRFAQNFMVTNQSKLVNLSQQARKLLEQSGSISKANGRRVPRRYRS